MDFARNRAVEVKARVKEREGWIAVRGGMMDEGTLGAGFGRLLRQYLARMRLMLQSYHGG